MRILAILAVLTGFVGCSVSRQDAVCNQVCTDAERGEEVNAEVVEYCGCF